MAVKLKAHGAGQPDHFEGLGEPANIRNRQKTVELEDVRHSRKPVSLSIVRVHQRIDPEAILRDLHTLGLSQFHCYKRFSRIIDLENAISNQQKSMELMDDGHPNIPGLLSNLGTGHRTRFDLLGELADLDTAIAKQSKAVKLTEHGQP
jgi:hypothetical protein